jgi:hypothetical protein
MAEPLISKRLALLGALTLLVLSGTGQIYPARAAETAQFTSDSKYLDLGTEFMREIGGSLKRSDLYLSGAGKFELAEQSAGSTIPEGEPLLLRAVIGKNRVNGRQDIYSVKNNGRLMISLSDFFLALDFPIKVNAKAGTAQGWIGNEAQVFDLDLNKQTLTLVKQTVNVKPDEIDNTGDDILVTADALQAWLGLEFNYDLSALELSITASGSLPIEEAFIRSQKGSRRNDPNAGSKLPVIEPEYGYASIPYLDTDLGINVYQSPGNRRTHDEEWSTLMSGDYAGFNTNAYFSGTDIKPFLNTARVTMRKEDPRGNLLGPIGATSYKFGDVNAVSGTMIGSGSQERGFTLNNAPLNRDTTKTYTEIKGDSHPGWDVELYRNDAYLDIRHVDTDGRYDFGKVDLNIGLNDFKLIFYSPQGQKIEEHKIVNVDSSMLGQSDGRYAISLTQNGRSVYSRVPQTGDGVGGPHFAASYDFGIKNVGTLSSTISSDNDSGTRRTFVETGLASAWNETLLNSTIALDTSNAAYGSILTARRNFGKQSGRLEYDHYSEGFNAGTPAGASIKDTYNASLSGPLAQRLYFLKNLNYSLNGGYSEAYSGDSGLGGSATLTTGIGSVVLNAGIQYSTSSSPSNPSTGTVGTTTDSSTANFGLRGAMFGGGWRLGAQYEILPKKQLTSADAEYTHSLAENLDSTTTFTYEPLTKLKTIAVGLNWITPKVVISPRIQYDNTENVVASVNAHFGITADPYLSNIQLTGNYVTGNGGVMARIFQDNNGNGIFDDGDKLLKDANIVAIQGQQSAASNEDGIAFIPGLPKNILTDIVVDAGSSEAAYGLSLFKGVAILPHPGAVTKLDFPIVESSEIDGQAEYTDEQGKPESARGLRVSLTAPDGKLQKYANAESDGYWSMSVVEPGIYYLTAAGDETNPGYFIPRMMELKPDGTTLFGQSVKLTRGFNTKFNFSAENAPPDGANHARVIRPGDIASQKFQLEVGSFHSRLAMTLAWYKMKLYSGRVPGGLELAMPMAGMPQDDKGISSLVLKPGAVTSMEQGAAACQAIGEMHIGDCAVNVITTYRAPSEEKINPYKHPPVEIAARKPDEEKQASELPAVVSAVEPDVIVRPSHSQTMATSTVSPALAADLADYVAANPSVNKDVLKNKTVLLNLGSYNSRTLLAVMWYKIKTRYTSMIGDATLLVRPTDSNASAQTGKYTLRASLPTFNIDDANNRCRLLTAQGQYCSVEVLPSGLQASR